MNGACSQVSTKIPAFPKMWHYGPEFPKCTRELQRFQGVLQQTPAYHRSDTYMYYLEDFSHIIGI